MLEFRILGPLEVLDDDRTIELGGARQRAVLAILLLHRGETVSVDRIVDLMWGERPPATAVKTVQVYVSHLRRALVEDVVVELARRIRARGRRRAHRRAALRAARRRGSRRARRRRSGARRRAPAHRRSRCGAGRRSAISPTSGSRRTRRRGSRSCASRRSRSASRPISGSVVTPSWWPSSRGSCASTRCASACARSTCSRSTGRAARRTRWRASATRGARSSTSWGSSRGGSCASSSRRSSRRIPRSTRPARASAHRDAGRPSPQPRADRRRRGAGRGVAAVAVARGAASVGADVAVLPDSVAVIDPESGLVVADVPVGARPEALAADERFVWVANVADGTVSADRHRQATRRGHDHAGDRRRSARRRSRLRLDRRQPARPGRALGRRPRDGRGLGAAPHDDDDRHPVGTPSAAALGGGSLWVASTAARRRLQGRHRDASA